MNQQTNNLFVICATVLASFVMGFIIGRMTGDNGGGDKFYSQEPLIIPPSQRQRFDVYAN